MNDDPVNILPNNDNDISDQKLMDYLNGNLSIEEKLEMDKLITGSVLMNDAVQGLQQFENTKKLSASVDQLNAGLHKQLQKKKPHRRKLKLNNEQWIYLAVILILALAIICFIVIRERLGG